MLSDHLIRIGTLANPKNNASMSRIQNTMFAECIDHLDTLTKSIPDDDKLMLSKAAQQVNESFKFAVRELQKQGYKYYSTNAFIDWCRSNKCESIADSIEKKKVTPEVKK